MKKTIIAISILGLLTANCGRKANEVKPERRDITATVFASGSLEPEYVYNLTAQTEGIISRLDVEAGDTVIKEQVIGVIDNRSNAITAASSGELLKIAERNASPSG